MSTAFAKPFLKQWVELAAAPYLAAGKFAHGFARGKLGHDPAFAGLVQHGLIPENARILDIGCGQGLLASWLHAAQTLNQRGAWPKDLPVPPAMRAYHGIELMPRDVERGRQALGKLGTLSDRANIVLGDMCKTVFPAADVVVILDVLHYVPIAAQDDVLARVRDALAPRGTLLLRVGDAAAGLPFQCSVWVDRMVTWVRGHHAAPLYCRTLQAWHAALARLGFAVTPMPMHQGTPFANVLLAAKLGHNSEPRAA